MKLVEAVEIINKTKKMRKQTILLASVILLILVSVIAAFMSFNQESEDNTYISLAFATNTEKTVSINLVEDDGYTLMKANCYICHNPNSASHDEIIAPPFKAVKMRYTKQYNKKEEFIDAVTSWVLEPSEGKALMQGAVEQFKVMPKMTLDKNDLEKIASYLYDNDVDEPEWMEEHMSEMKGNKMGKGHGQGKGKGKGMKYN